MCMSFTFLPAIYLVKIQTGISYQANDPTFPKDENN
jgi:hypothetical protein